MAPRVLSRRAYAGLGRVDQAIRKVEEDIAAAGRRTLSSEVRGGYGLVARVVLVRHFQGLAIDFSAAQHDLDDLACVGDVAVRAAVDDDQRGQLAGFDRAPVAGTDEACGVAGRDRDRLERRQPCRDEQLELMVQALALHVPRVRRSEEHTSELQSRSDLVCRLLLEKKKIKTLQHILYDYFLALSVSLVSF